MMDKIKLEIKGLSYSQASSGAYALILGEVDGKRRLPIVIGGAEAQSIAMEIEKIKPARPLTHDLFKSFADAFNIRLLEVTIYKFSEGVFYSKLLCANETLELSIDSRTSDAVALAIRFGSDIYTVLEVMEDAAIVIDEKTEQQEETEGLEEFQEAGENPLETLDLVSLDEELQKAVSEENYERASHIRDEINRRKNL
jgi:bifunctional DNase/RNase